MRPYPFKTRPYRHQVQAIRKMMRTGFGGALLMEPRTGKTKTAIDYLSVLVMQDKLDRAVIICPPRVMDVWVQEFHTHCPVNYHITVWDQAERKKGKLNPPRGPYALNVLLVNYEAFSTPGKKLSSGRRSKATGRYSFKNQLAGWTQGKATACVLDESHKIKSPSGKAATMIVSMQNLFRYRLILTGTPVTKADRMFDIWMQWEFLNPYRFEELPTVAEFKNRYGQWTNRNGYPQFLKPLNTEELISRIHEDAFSVTRAECYDLPPKIVNVINVPLEEQTGQVYDELAKKMVAEIEHGDLTHLTEASIPLVLTLRLSQITGGYAKTLEGELIPVGREKFSVLEELLSEAIENDEKMVIAARFRSELDEIIAMCAQKAVPVFPVRGGMKREETTQNIADFQSMDGVSVVAMNPRAGGVGIDLSSTSHMVWYSLVPSWVDYTQACDRIALSPVSTTYTYLLAEKTVDHVLYKTLQEDGDIAQVILNDPRKVLR